MGSGVSTISTTGKPQQKPKVNAKELNSFVFQLEPMKGNPGHLLVDGKKPYLFDEYKLDNGVLSKLNHSLKFELGPKGLNITLKLNGKIETVGFLNTLHCEMFLFYKGAKFNISKEVKICITRCQGESPPYFQLWLAEWKAFSPTWDVAVDSVQVILAFKIIKEMLPVALQPKSRGPNINVPNNIPPFVKMNIRMDVSGFLYKDSLSDLKILCDDHVFNAHRIILSCRSAVFSAMFQANMMENNTGRIIIEDFKPEVIREMLRHIYTGRVRAGTLKEHMDLFRVADKYQLTDLLAHCLGKLMGNVALENVVELYLFGQAYREKQLCEKTLDIMKRNKKKLINTPEIHNDYCSLYPDLMFELFRV